MEIGYERTRLAAGDGETTEPSQTPPRPAAQTRGATFGRYVVLDALGEGGMGVVYARRWPNPDPFLFGYHEIFHLFVFAAAALHYVVIWDLVA